MANKYKIEKGSLLPFFFPFLRKFLLSLLFGGMFFSTAYAQNLSKRYVASNQNEGVLYFVFPQKGYQDQNASNFIYDLTYLDSKDSMTLNFTFKSKESLVIDSLAITSETVNLKEACQKIYVEFAKSKWIYRNTSKVLYADIRRFFMSKEAPIIQVYCKDGSVVNFKIKQGKWGKEAPINLLILDLMEANK